MTTAPQEAENPLLNITDLIDYAAVRPEHVMPAVKKLAADLEKALARATAPETPATWDAVVVPLEEASLAFSRSWGAIGHLQSVVDTPALRDAFNEALPLATDLYLRIFQDEALYKKYLGIEKSDAFKALSPVRQRIIRREIRDFECRWADASHPLTFPEAGDAVRTARELASKYKPLFDAER